MNKMNKRLIVAMITICMSVFATANGNPDNELKAALKLVPNGDLIQVYYAGITLSDIKLAIKDEQGRLIHREHIEELYSFSRMYNLSQLQYGKYVFMLTTEEGTIEQAVVYSPESEGKFKFYAKPLYEEGTRQLLSVPAGQESRVRVSIYSSLTGLIHQEVQSSENGFAQIYRLESPSKGETLRLNVRPLK